VQARQLRDDQGADDTQPSDQPVRSITACKYTGGP
jgi:hypothetical protein